MKRVLIVGVSTRAAAESAARAGFDVTTIDAFADLDQHEHVRPLSLERGPHQRFTAAAAARAAGSVASDAVVYLSSFENHPRAVSALAAGRSLWGNPPDVLRRVRDPFLLERVLRARGVPVPRVHRLPIDATAARRATEVHELTLPALSVAEGSEVEGSELEAWLVKPVASGGGHGIHRWQSSPKVALSVPSRRYLQELVEGTPGSVMFVAADGRAVPFGISRQLVGESAFGAKDYQYCGNILASVDDPQFTHDQELTERACNLASTVSEKFGLIGVNGIDFIARDGVPYPTEVNPRWSASMELAEHAYHLSIFGMHASACVNGTLPDFELRNARQNGGAMGKAIVFAQRDVVMGDTRLWLGDSNVRDVPHPGERIAAGRPVCTVLARAADSLACHATLVARAQRISVELADLEASNPSR